MKRHEAREFAIQALFAVEVGKAEPTAAVDHVLHERDSFAEADRAYILRLVEGTRAWIADIDRLLADNMQGWQMDRVAKVELTVLRMAGYELLHERDVDFATVVDEAVELCKSFSDEAAGKFVNGVLAKVGPAFIAARA